MKKHRLIAALAGAAAIFLASPRAADAQTAAVIRGDVTGTVAWLAARNRPTEPYGGRDWSSSLFAAGSAGWHWTDNVKTEIDFGAGTTTRTYSTQPVTSGGRTTYVFTRSEFSRRTLGISVQYQFFHNAWFHPHLATGAHFTWERRTDEIEPVYFSGAADQPAITGSRDPHTTLTLRPFVAGGFKSYMTDRTFFRTDLRVAFHHGIDETLFRFGFGFDF